MARLKKMITLPEDLAAEIDEWRLSNQVSNRCEGIRALVRKGLDASREEQRMLEIMREQRRQMAA